MNTTPHSLLLVEDDATLGATLTERLQKEGYAVSLATSIAEARQRLQEHSFAIAVVDVGLPDGTGYDLSPSLQAQAIPFIFLTAMNSAAHRLQGFDAGALDYIPKPFHLRELLLRLSRALEHAPRTKGPISTHGITIDLERLVISAPEGFQERLQLRDTKILQLLISQAPRVVSRGEILQAILPDSPADEKPTPRTIDNSIVRLRNALRTADKELIISVRGVGYQWDG